MTTIKTPAPHPGDAIEVEAPAQGSTPRSAEILEVLGPPERPHFRVRWDDGHESLYYLAGGMRLIPRHG
jgi:uncharacterized protein DUF1918